MKVNQTKRAILFIMLMCLSLCDEAQPKEEAGIKESDNIVITTETPSPTIPLETVEKVETPEKVETVENAEKVENVEKVEIAPTITQNIENPKSNEFPDNVDTLQANILQQEEKKIEEEQHFEENLKFSQWVAEEMDRLAEIEDVPTLEVFSFILNKEIQFKWNPTEDKKGPLRFVVEVFEYTRGDIMFPQNPDEDDYVSVFVQAKENTFFTNLGQVYLKKLFTIESVSDYHLIRLENHYHSKMMVQISLEHTKFVPEAALDDDSLKIPASKMHTLLEELEQTERTREKSFRTEWSIKDRQEHHQSEMLILTGVELSVIIVTAIVQIYCIKNLFDNRLIV